MRKREPGKIGKRALVLLVASMSGIWIWVVLHGQSPPEEEERRLSRHDAQLRSEGIEIRASARDTAEATEAPVEIFSVGDEPETTSESASESCSEMSRLMAGSRRTITFGPNVELDEQACGIAIRVITRARMPALPDLPGFEIPDPFEDNLARRLANEPDNPSWARVMEGRALEEVANLLDFPVTSLHAVCRSTMCGVLFTYSTASHTGGNRNQLAQRLADALRFSGYQAGETLSGTIDFTYIYLGNWDTKRPVDPPPAMPTTFEEIRDAFATGSDQTSP